MRITIFVALSTFLVFGCSNPSTTSGNDQGDIRGVLWKLVSFEPLAGETIMLVTTEDYYLVLFADTSLSGKDSLCGNTYNASCNIGSNDSISIGPITTTKIGCRSSYYYMDYLRALEKATSFTANKDKLTVFHSGGAKKLEFVKQ